MLSLEHVSKSYGAGEALINAVADVTLRIPKGRFAVITGPSGSGKSTLLSIIGLLVSMDSGAYFINGIAQNEQKEKERCWTRLHQIGYVYQSFNLLDDENALSNVILPLGYLGVPKKERTERGREMLRQVGLLDRAKHYPTTLSGGEQQRVSIARALITNPMLLLADEPTGNLDSKTSSQIQQLLRSFNEKGQTVIMVTHDERIVQPGDIHIAVIDGRAEIVSG